MRLVGVLWICPPGSRRKCCHRSSQKASDEDRVYAKATPPFARGMALLLWLSAVSGWAGFEEGIQAYKNRDYATAAREWLPLAQQVMHARNSSWALCTPRGTACRRTMVRRPNGFARPPRKATLGAIQSRRAVPRRSGVPRDPSGGRVVPAGSAEGLLAHNIISVSCMRTVTASPGHQPGGPVVSPGGRPGGIPKPNITSLSSTWKA